MDKDQAQKELEERVAFLLEHVDKVCKHIEGHEFSLAAMEAGGLELYCKGANSFANRLARAIEKGTTGMSLPLDITAYALPDDGAIERCQQRDGSFKWAIRCRGDCMNHEGEWEFDPMPSSRDDDFMRRCRFDSAESAYAAWSKCNPQETAVRVIDEFAQRLAMKLASDKDDLIRQAINRVLGEQWTLDDLNGRCRIVALPGKEDQFFLDNIPILATFPPGIETHVNTMTATFNYRFLVSTSPA